MLIFALISFLAVNNFHSATSNAIPPPPPSVCQLDECVWLSNEITASIDESVDPCDDFHKFVCGSFIKHGKIPDDSLSAGVTTRKINSITRNLIQLLTTDIDANEPDFVNLPKIYYQTCISRSTDLIEETLKIYIEKIGGWPLLDGENWSDKHWNWVETIKKFRHYGFESNEIFSVTVEMNLTDVKNKKRWISISEGENAFIASSLKRNALDIYNLIIREAAVQLGAIRDENLYENTNELINFEITLARAFIIVPENSPGTWITIKELQAKHNYAPWLTYLQNLMPSGLTINENDEIEIKSLKLIETIGRILRETPTAVVANYLIWRSICIYTPFLSENIEDLHRKYNSITITDPFRINGRSGRETYCVDDILSKKPLDMFVGYLFIKKYYTDTKYSEIVSEIITNIRHEMRRAFKESDWMDSETKNHALKKVDSISQQYIGYRKEFLNETLLENAASGLQFDSRNYIINALNLKINSDNLAYSEYKFPSDVDLWTNQLSPAVYNAYYDPLANSISFPAAYIVNNIVKSDGVPNYINYGFFGNTVGHELSHAFDNDGSHYDWNGNLNNWWSKKTEMIFAAKSQCIVEEYGNMTESTTHRPVDGVATLGENLADIEGDQFAYSAYIRKTGGAEPILPKLKYNGRQLFWIATAWNFCDIYTIDTINAMLNSDVHSPGELRVIGAVKNSKEFAKDFQCKEGTPMNPIKKCNIWQ